MGDHHVVDGDVVPGGGQADLGAFVSLPEFINRWPQLKRYHDPQFVDLVDWLIA